MLAGCTSSFRAAAPAPPQPQEPPVRVSGSGTALPAVQKLAEAYAKRQGRASFRFDPGTNSGGAIQGVLQGTIDLAAVVRPLSPAEANEPLRYDVFARDTVVFAVKLPNRVDGLSTAEVQDIYGGSLTNWEQLGGPAEPIIVLDRDADESARKLVLLTLMGERPVETPTVVLTKAQDMVRALEATPYSLGYTSLGLLRVEQPRDVRVLALDGVVPDPNSRAFDSYPWQLTFGLVYHREAGTAVRSFVEWVLGSAGHRLLERYDYATPSRRGGAQLRAGRTSAGRARGAGGQ